MYKHFLQQSFCLFFLLLSHSFVFAQFGQFASAIKINNSLSNQFYNTTGTGTSQINPSGIQYQSQNFGSFPYLNGALRITGAEVKTFKNPQSANVCGARFYYIVYPTAAVPVSPVFTMISIPFKVDCNTGTGVFNDGLGPCTFGDQKWSTEALNIDLTNFCPGNYTLEIYYDIFGDDETPVGCSQIRVINDEVLGNYKANFSITSTLSSSATTTTPSICAGQNINLSSNGNLGKPPYSFSWTGPNSFVSSFQNPVISGATALSQGTYSVLVTDACGNTSTATTSVVVNSLPPTPTASVTTQPTCTTPTGTITFTAPVGNNFNYSINGSSYLSATSFSGLTPGNYNVTVRNIVTGCISVPLVLTVNNVPALPPVPTGSVTIQPTCTTPTGTIVLTGPINSNFEYSVNGTNYQPGLSFAGLVPGSYNVTVRNTTNGCVSLPLILNIAPVPSPPAAPTATVTTQPNCLISTGTITITAPLGSNLTYSVNGIVYQAGLIFNGLVSGNYNVTVRNNIDGCISSPTVLQVNPIPSPPPAPGISIVQPTCFVATGSISISSPLGSTLTYSINGTTYQSGTVFNNLNPGTYNVSVTNTQTGCISGTTAVTLNAIPPPPPPPTVTSPITLCQNSNTQVLTANGTNLIWYSTATGGTGSANAPIPQTVTTGSTTFYVSQRTGFCESQRAVIIVQVNPVPTANAGNDKLIIVGDQVTLDGSGSGFISFNWAPGVGGTNITPTVNPVTTTTYLLTTTNSFNCTASDAIIITVIPYCIKVMDAFTPNGDGIHDRWLVTNGQNCTKQISAKVYNRYGGLVYENNNYQNTWDGTYKGKNVSDATYYYILELTLLNNQRIFLKGDVTVLR